MNLHYRKYGEGKPLIILHGLFGSSDNWHSLGRRWGKHFQVFVLDQRNHGSSPHESAMNYEEMSQDLFQFISQQRLGPVHIVGHSMGGKVGMLFASSHPDLVEGLVVLDIGIEKVVGKHETILKMFDSMDPTEYTSRGEVGSRIDELINSTAISQFLQKNILRRLDGSLAWKFNHHALLEHYNDLTMALELDQPYIGQILFVRGGDSDYLEDSLTPEILDTFPLARLETIEGAGHWLHADKPAELFSLVLEFMD